MYNISLQFNAMQLILLILLLTFSLVCGQLTIFGSSHDLPTALRLGSAIVAAVEEDVEQEEQEEQLLAEKRFTAELEGITNLFNETSLATAGRGKHHKKKKLMKYLYPLVMGILLAKTVLIPLLLKMLTAISTSSFVMSKIALGASALLALKWIIGGSMGKEAKERLEIIHLPVDYASSWSDSSWSNNKNQKYRQNYIPLNVGKDISLTSTQSTYRYPQHNYYNNRLQYHGKPFL